MKEGNWKVKGCRSVKVGLNEDQNEVMKDTLEDKKRKGEVWREKKEDDGEG